MREVTVDFDTPEKKEVKLRKGIYSLECWGASGGSLDLESSSGSYVSGVISIQSTRKFYLFVGEKATPKNATVTFNGGGAAYLAGSLSSAQKASHGSSEGGASDIRLQDGAWNDLESLKSRIMVASGGGGETRYKNKDSSKAAKGGNGGTLVGEQSSYSRCYGCTGSAYKSAGGGEQEFFF